MKLTKNINFRNFDKKVKSNNVRRKLQNILKTKNQVFDSLSSKYKYSYSKKITNELKKKITNFRTVLLRWNLSEQKLNSLRLARNY